MRVHAAERDLRFRITFGAGRRDGHARRSRAQSGEFACGLQWASGFAARGARTTPRQSAAANAAARAVARSAIRAARLGEADHWRSAPGSRSNLAVVSPSRQ